MLSARMRRALSMTAYLAFWSLGDSEFSPSVLFICPQGKIIPASQPSRQVWNSNIFSVLSVKYQMGTFGWVLTHNGTAAFFFSFLFFYQMYCQQIPPLPAAPCMQELDTILGKVKVGVHEWVIKKQLNWSILIILSSLPKTSQRHSPV